jgi:hypothetical protein
MNSHQYRKKDEHAAGRELRDIDDAYAFNAASGLYEPKSYARQDTANRRVAGTDKNQPLFTHTNRDWIGILVGLAGIIVSALTLVLPAGTVYYARQQWHEAQTTAGASLDAVTKAQASIDQSRMQFYADQGHISLWIRSSPLFPHTLPISQGREPRGTGFWLTLVRHRLSRSVHIQKCFSMVPGTTMKFPTARKRVISFRAKKRSTRSS